MFGGGHSSETTTKSTPNVSRNSLRAKAYGLAHWAHRLQPALNKKLLFSTISLLLQQPQLPAQSPATTLIKEAIKILTSSDSAPVIKTTDSYRCTTGGDVHQEAHWKNIEKVGHVQLEPDDIINAYDSNRRFLPPKGQFAPRPTPPTKANMRRGRSVACEATGSGDAFAAQFVLRLKNSWICWPKTASKGRFWPTNPGIFRLRHELRSRNRPQNPRLHMQPNGRAGI